MKPTPIRHPDVSRMVGRCHVGESILEVLRYVVSRLDGGRKGFLKLGRNTRRYVIAAAISAHEENRGLYRHVMARSSESYRPRYFFHPETKAVTIRKARKPRQKSTV